MVPLGPGLWSARCPLLSTCGAGLDKLGTSPPSGALSLVKAANWTANSMHTEPWCFLLPHPW